MTQKSLNISLSNDLSHNSKLSVSAGLSRNPSNSRSPVRVKASYDAARTNSENSRYWQNAAPYGLTPDQMNNPAVRSTLKKRAQYEYNNGGYTKRIVNKTSNEVVGKRIKINIESSNSKFNDACEKDLAVWQRLIKLERGLRTLVKDKIRDGEALAIPYTNKLLKHPVQLDLARFSCDRLTSTHYAGKDNNIDGVILDDMGINPISYEIAKYTGAQGMLTSTETTKYDADRVYHWFEQEFSEQHRGIPELTTTLDINAARRAYSKSVLSTAQMQSNFAMVLEQDIANPEDDAVEEMSEFDLERNMVTVLPPNAKLSTVDASQPIDTFRDYNNEMVMEASAPLNMPHNMVKGSSAEMNFSSARFDYYIMFGKDRDIVRSDMELTILDDFILQYITEWALVNYNQFPMGMPDDLTVSYGYEVDKYINPLQESKADALRIEKNENGVSLQSLKSFNASQGKDWKEEVIQGINEELFIKEQRKLILGEDDQDDNTGDNTDEATQ